MKRLICLICSFLLLAAFVSKKDFIYKNHTFRAVVKNVRLQRLLIEQGKNDNDIVSVTVPAVLFAKPIKIADVRRNKGSFGNEIDFLVSYTKANIEGTKEDILSFWDPSARDDVKRSVEDDKLFQRNREILLENPGLVIMGIVKQKDSTSILRDYGSGLGIVGITLKAEKGKFYLIEKPTNDLELAIIEASFK